MSVRQATYSPAGVAVRVQLEAAVGDDVIAELLGDTTRTFTPAELTVAVNPGIGTVPERAPDVSLMNLRAWRDTTHVTFAARDVVATIESSHACVVGPPEQLADGVRALRIHILGHLLAMADVFVMHGAVLSSADARVLVVGTTGRGKSTAALAAHERAGWCAHADDLCVVRGFDGAAQVAALGIPLHVPADLGGRAPARAPVLPNDRRNRRVLTVEPTPWSPLTDVVVVGHGDATETVIAPIDGRQALHPLLEAFAAARHTAFRKAFVDIAGSLCRLRTWRLALGRDQTCRLATTMAALDVITA